MILKYNSRTLIFVLLQKKIYSIQKLNEIQEHIIAVDF